jgi:hypothetical protein
LQRQLAQLDKLDKEFHSSASKGVNDSSSAAQEQQKRFSGLFSSFVAGMPSLLPLSMMGFGKTDASSSKPKVGRRPRQRFVEEESISSGDLGVPPQLHRVADEFNSSASVASSKPPLRRINKPPLGDWNQLPISCSDFLINYIM